MRRASAEPRNHPRSARYLYAGVVNLNLSVFWTLVVLAIGTPVLTAVLVVLFFLIAGPVMDV